jgi:hypothetical protein
VWQSRKFSKQRNAELFRNLRSQHQALENPRIKRVNRPKRFTAMTSLNTLETRHAENWGAVEVHGAT